MQAAEFDSELEMPTGKDPNQNASLTITINYSLNFVDSKNRMPGLTFEQGGKTWARPSRPTATSKAVAIKDWDFAAATSFARKFAKAESFWNFRFVLITPTNYDGFDYDTFAGPGWVCRPNVNCLFRLSSVGSTTHLKINVVRSEKFFRSDKLTYHENDVNDRTVWHELGHELDQLHIRALMGDASCLVDHDGCYAEPAGVAPNIQGTGTGLVVQNAKAWHELIGHHTETATDRWKVTLDTKTPARKVPLGLKAIGTMPAFW